MTNPVPAETTPAAPPTRHWSEAAAEGRATRTGRIAREVEDCLGVEEMPCNEIRGDRRLAVAAALADIQPADEIEAMLTTQLLTVHGLAMDCARSARDSVKEERVRLSYMVHAARMVSLYARHVDKVERRREWAEWRAITAQERAKDALLEAAFRAASAPRPAPAGAPAAAKGQRA
jgi:hypothetical protein